MYSVSTIEHTSLVEPSRSQRAFEVSMMSPNPKRFVLLLGAGPPKSTGSIKEQGDDPIRQLDTNGFQLVVFPDDLSDVLNGQ